MAEPSVPSPVSPPTASSLPAASATPAHPAPPAPDASRELPDGSVFAQPPLELHNVSKSYGEKKVLERCELTTPAGSVVGLLGQNAAGKTTLIKCALGLIRPSGGTASVFGEPAWSLSPA